MLGLFILDPVTGFAIFLRMAKRKRTKVEEIKKPRGKPPSYRPSYAAEARSLCENGARNSDLARYFEVAMCTIHVWRLKYPEFAAAVRLGKQVADERVEQALYDSALGFEFEVEIEPGKTVIRTLPPNIGAIRTWLFNRQPDKWKEKLELTDRRGGMIDLEPDQIKRLMVKRMIEWGLVDPANVPPDLLPAPDADTIDTDAA